MIYPKSELDSWNRFPGRQHVPNERHYRAVLHAASDMETRPTRARERERERERIREYEILSGINRGKIARAIVEFRNEIGRRGYEDTLSMGRGVRVADNDTRGGHASRMFALTELCRSPRQPEISVRASATIMFSVSRVPGLTAAKIAPVPDRGPAARVTR